MAIAKQYLIPQAMKDSGLKDEMVNLQIFLLKRQINSREFQLAHIKITLLINGFPVTVINQMLKIWIKCAIRIQSTSNQPGVAQPCCSLINQKNNLGSQIYLQKLNQFFLTASTQYCASQAYGSFASDDAIYVRQEGKCNFCKNVAATSSLYSSPSPVLFPLCVQL